MIKAETLQFIKDVAANNDRDWFAENKDRYETSRTDLFEFIAELIPLLAAADPAFPIEASAKKCLMRIYRDVRFSKNKDPYKNNFGISFNGKSNGIPNPEYYLHLQPGKSFFGVGFWMPDAAILKKIREEIDYNTEEIVEILNADSFSKSFALSKEDTLKNAPKGYEITHSQIELLKLKSFIAIYPLTDKEILNSTIVEKLKSAFENIQPFVLFLRNAVAQ
ncbi:MAG: DUF2461 domain-containing protein [Pedobacter sp.]